MGLQVDPPFGLGQTLGVTNPNDSMYGISSGSYGDNWVGCVKEFTDVDPTTGKVRSKTFIYTSEDTKYDFLTFWNSKFASQVQNTIAAQLGRVNEWTPSFN